MWMTDELSQCGVSVLAQSVKSDGAAFWRASVLRAATAAAHRFRNNLHSLLLTADHRSDSGSVASG